MLSLAPLNVNVVRNAVNGSPREWEPMVWTAHDAGKAFHSGRISAPTSWWRNDR
jgi:hypothetical protein